MVISPGDITEVPSRAIGSASEAPSSKGRGSRRSRHANALLNSRCSGACQRPTPSRLRSAEILALVRLLLTSFLCLAVTLLLCDSAEWFDPEHLAYRLIVAAYRILELSNLVRTDSIPALADQGKMRMEYLPTCPLDERKILTYLDLPRLTLTSPASFSCSFKQPYPSPIPRLPASPSVPARLQTQQQLSLPDYSFLPLPA